MADQTEGAAIAAVLAGGSGSRIGGAKPTAQLNGQPLISYPLAAALEAVQRVAVVTKADVELPKLDPRVELWQEPQQPRHPVVGVIEALRRADGAAVVVIACDLPLLRAEVVALLATCDAERRPAVAAVAEGRLQPLLARYQPQALGLLKQFDTNAPLTEQLAALEPLLVEVPSEVTFNVNDLQQLEAVSRRLRSSSDPAE